MGANVCKGEKVLDEVVLATNNHKRIELELKKDKAEEKKVIKILLLGSADCGKSTIAKQMRILHTNGFNETELINYRYMIHTNYIIIYHYIVKGIIALKMDIPDDEKQIVTKFTNAYNIFLDYDDEDQIKIINQISSCVCVSEACKRLNDFYVPDNTTYLFAESDRILQPQYKPTEKDVLHARASTTGVHEITFAFRKFGISSLDFFHPSSLQCGMCWSLATKRPNTLEPNGGQCGSVQLNVQKWISPQMLIHSVPQQKDLFEEKLKHVPLSKFLPQYTGDNNYDSALEFLQRLYLDCQNDDARHIYNHVTNATDTKNVQFVFGAACDIILQNNLTRAGMT